jgi:hypothetical protein
MEIEIIDSGVVAARPDQMYAWPGITRAFNGDILVSASERKLHVCPYGRQVVIRSKNNGETWELPQEIYNSELDDRDANILTLKDGTVVQSWFTSTAFEHYDVNAERYARVTEKIKKEVIGTWMLKSHDNGCTWNEKALRIPVGYHISPIELSDSSLISIGTEYCDNDNQNKVLSVYKSFDQGESWQHVTVIESEYKTDSEGVKTPILNENHTIETSPGKLVALFRGEDGGCIYQASSEDYGKTWTKPYKTTICGYPPHMLRLSNGAIMALYSHRKEPFSIRAVVSHDECETWDTDNILTIHQWDDQPDMGYPVSLEIEPGKILTVFYCKRYKNVPEHVEAIKAGEPEGILYSIFKYY